MISPSRAWSTKVFARITALVLVAAALAVCLAPSSAFASYRQTYGFFAKWGFPTPYPSVDFQPNGMVLGSNGDLYVATHDNYISEFTTQGVLVQPKLCSTATNVWGSDGIQYLYNVAIRGDDMWVADYNHGVAKFDTSGNYLGVSIDRVPSVTYFDQVLGVAIDASGCVYVSDHGSNDLEGYRVSKFTSSGAYVTTFGDTGSVQDGRLWSASSIAIGPDFSVYVADPTGYAVRRFTPSKPGRTSYALTATWRSSAFNAPAGVTTDANGNIFVVDSQASNTITKLSPSGTALARFGATGTGNGQFTYAYAAAVDSAGSVYVDDRDAATVQRFVPLDLGPTTSASANLSVKKGKKVTFKFMATDDWSPTCSVTIKVFKGTKLKAAIACGSGASAVWRTKAWTCKLAKATYTWKVYASDTTGHSQQNVASKTLKVK